MKLAQEHLRHIFTEDLFVVDEPETGTSHEKTAILDDDNQQTAQASEPEAVRYQGANEKGVLFIVYDPGHEFLNATDLDFLMKIIESGLRLGKDDIALANSARYAIQQIRDEIAHEYMVFFGDHEKIGLNPYPMYKVIEEDGVRMLYAEALADIGADRQKKLQLWNALKSMFNI